MRRPRFHIAGLMVLVLVAAIGLFAMRHLPKSWPGPALSLALFVNALAAHAILLLGIALLLNLLATALALVGKRRVRAGAVGYAAGGWIYLGLSFQVSWFTAFFGDLTMKHWTLLNQAQTFYSFSANMDFKSYAVVGHSLATLAAGLVVGWLARGLVRRPRALTQAIINTTGQS